MSAAMPLSRVQRCVASPRALLMAQLIAWSAYSLSTYLTLLPSLPSGQRLPMLAAKIARGAVGLAASGVLLVLYRLLRARHAGPALVIGTAVTGCAILGVVWMLVYRAWIAPTLLVTPPPFARELLARASLDMVFVLLAWTGVYYAVAAWQALQEQERRLSEAQQIAQRAQFEMLSYQLNPHFLFNALNSIRAMIGEDAQRAKDMVTHFSAFLRYTLAADATAQTTVAEEFDVINGYLAIERIRFEHRLDAIAELQPDAADCRIPRFMVHPLVENAIKHGGHRDGEPLALRVRATRSSTSLHISVANTGRLGSAGDGVGWRNIRRRLDLLYGSAARCQLIGEDGWVIATIDLPIMARTTVTYA